MINPVDKPTIVNINNTAAIGAAINTNNPHAISGNILLLSISLIFLNNLGNNNNINNPTTNKFKNLNNPLIILETIIAPALFSVSILTDVFLYVSTRDTVASLLIFNFASSLYLNLPSIITPLSTVIVSASI